VGGPFDALFDTLDPSLIPGSVDWARPDLAVFPDEATDSNTVRVVMPEELRKVYDDLKKEADGLSRSLTHCLHTSFKKESRKLSR
jgi:hypothetical protein